MNIIKKLFVNNQEYRIISDNIILEMFAPGRGILIVQSTVRLSGLIKYYVGEGNTYLLYFSGYIEDCQEMNNKQQRLFVKELSNLLNQKYPVSLRHVNVSDVVMGLAETTALNFIIEAAPWNSINIPTVSNIGTGFFLLKFLAVELKIKNCIYHQTAEDVIYFGSWENSKLGNIQINLPAKLLTQISVSGGNFTIIPKFRPGIKLNINNNIVYVNRVEITGYEMRWNWVKSLWI